MTGRLPMGGTLDQTDGHSNDEAAVLVDDKSLESDRKLDQVVGKVTEKVERVKGKLEQVGPLGQVVRVGPGERGQESAVLSPSVLCATTRRGLAVTLGSRLERCDRCKVGQHILYLFGELCRFANGLPAHLMVTATRV
jgi:uncharacterized protein YjbJ (UPF0337 family)